MKLNEPSVPEWHAPPVAGEGVAITGKRRHEYTVLQNYLPNLAIPISINSRATEMIEWVDQSPIHRRLKSGKMQLNQTENKKLRN